jgi:hypothetical protein
MKLRLPARRSCYDFRDMAVWWTVWPFWQKRWLGILAGVVLGLDLVGLL